MSTVNDTDTLLINRGGQSFQIKYEDMSTVNDTDLLLINRGGESFQVQAQYISTGNAMFPCVIEYAALAEDDPGSATRFQDNSFTTTLTMNPDGNPPSMKSYKATVNGGFAYYGETNQITELVTNYQYYANPTTQYAVGGEVQNNSDDPYCTGITPANAGLNYNDVSGIGNLFDGQSNTLVNWPGSGYSDGNVGDFVFSLRDYRFGSIQQLSSFAAGYGGNVNYPPYLVQLRDKDNEPLTEWAQMDGTVSQQAVDIELWGDALNSVPTADQYPLNIYITNTEGGKGRCFNYGFRVNGELLVNAPAINSITNMILSGDNDLTNGLFQVGDPVTNQDGSATGTVTSILPGNPSIAIGSITGSFSPGDTIQNTVQRIPNGSDVTTLYLNFGTDGNIYDMSESDPGWLMTNDQTVFTLYFPTNFPSGQPVDTELPPSTFMSVDCKAEVVGAGFSPSYAETNVVTPT